MADLMAGGVLHLDSSGGNDNAGSVDGIGELRLGSSDEGEPFVNISKDTITVAFRFLLDVRNHPVLIHCKCGKV
ncbi:hypothetical protein Taro_054564 [Colocasia esculenta]|uniref:Tyrosine-protein phosphatase domain-containing protein n=1 Tax=Colocasia esculenta TaxID=4460 RepID=A0A843XQV6_COLES|nr:hypothetical protein [Colocasia esculenta]